MRAATAEKPKSAKPATRKRAASKPLSPEVKRLAELAAIVRKELKGKPL